MITPKELREKTEKSFFKIVSSELSGASVFPWTVPSNKQISGNNFSDWQKDLVPLFQESKAVKKKGYSVNWIDRKIDGIKQSVPEKIFFETLDDYLFFTARIKDYAKIVSAKEKIIAAMPELETWVIKYPEILLNHAELWDDLLKVCKYFKSHPPPHPFYLRELPIEVDTKFIEDNVTLVKRLLDQLLPADWVLRTENDFASRYQLKKVSVHAQIRVLDDLLKPVLRYDECSIPLDDAAWLKWLPEKVFIIENKACYLSFPQTKNAVAIWGEGFKSRISQHIPWLQKTRLICWFDLDSAGFEMLNMIREVYPHAESFLMDQWTYNEFERFAVNSIYRRKELPHLDRNEKNLYEFLQAREFKQRLEQERIPQAYVAAKLATIEEKNNN